MPGEDVTDIIERVVLAGVGLTTRALQEALPGFDLTFPQWRVLLVLGEEQEGMIVSEVAARIAVTVPATSRQLRRLARRQLVEIGPDSRDRRAARATLTPKGQAARQAILGYRRRRIAETVSKLSVTTDTIEGFAAVAKALDAYR